VPAGDTQPKPKTAPPAAPSPTPVQVAKVTAPAPETAAPALNPSTAKPAPPPEPGEADTKVSRPRTIKEALARRAESGLVGDKMKQDGGVKNLGVSALDVRGMSFGAYDAAIIQAIQQRWYSLLESRPTPRGKVVVEFRMHFDGRVTDVKVNDADVGELYSLFCQKAVQDPAPYPRWPSDMRRQLQADYRDVRFSFYYN
jgi:outer membrane biosynthesis protein TonB